MGDLALLNNIVVGFFDYAEQNGCIKMAKWRWFWEKLRVEGGLVALQFLDHLKGALKLLISVRMNPLAIFYDHWVKTVSPKKKKKNKRGSVIFLLAKNT